MRRHPLYRAMRLDKVGLAGLEATVQLYLDGRGDEIPARALMLRSKADLEVEARSLAKDLATLGADWKLTVHADHTQPGSGTAPGIHLDTFCVHAAHRGMPPNELADRLRAGTPPVFTRVADGVVKIDPRTLLPGDRDRLIQAFRQI